MHENGARRTQNKKVYTIVLVFLLEGRMMTYPIGDVRQRCIIRTMIGSYFHFGKVFVICNEGRLDSMSREAITEKGLCGDVREEIRTDGTITWAMCTEGGQF